MPQEQIQEAIKGTRAGARANSNKNTNTNRRVRTEDMRLCCQTARHMDIEIDDPLDYNRPCPEDLLDAMMHWVEQFPERFEGFAESVREKALIVFRDWSLFAGEVGLPRPSVRALAHFFLRWYDKWFRLRPKELPRRVPRKKGWFRQFDAPAADAKPSGLTSRPAPETAEGLAHRLEALRSLGIATCPS